MTTFSCTEDSLGGRRRTGARRLPGTLPHGDHGLRVNGVPVRVQCIEWPVSMHVSYARDVAAACVLRRAGRRAQLHWRGRLAPGSPTYPKSAVQGTGRRTRRTAGAAHPRARSRSRPAGEAVLPLARRMLADMESVRVGGGRAGRAAAGARAGGRHPVAVHRGAGRRAARLPRTVPGHPPGAGRERVASAGPLAAAERDRHRPGDRARRWPRPGAGAHAGAARAALGGLARVRRRRRRAAAR